MELASEVCEAFDGSLSILREWIDKGDAEKIEAAYHAEVSLA